jgi:isoleucyl-tRNA synthetase
MESLFAVRETVFKELEKAREEKRLGNSLEARVQLSAPDARLDVLTGHQADLASLFIVSEVSAEFHQGSELSVKVDKAPGAKCERCWNISTSVGLNTGQPTLCRRCQDVIKGIAP